MHIVRWAKSARDELAAMWVDADSTGREAITAAAAEIDGLLKNKPGEVGESRAANRRIAFVPPLGLTFDVIETNRGVKVLHVWLY
jgi:hypothetical protein